MAAFDPDLYSKELIAGFSKGLLSGNFPHALLIQGPKGVGKKAIAIALASAVLSPLDSKERTLETCSCPLCARIASGGHPDVKFFENEDGASIKVDQIRELMGWIRLRPFEAEKKILIVAAVENLVDEALNAFLKVLEEPPESTSFILLTEAPASLKTTLVSRCFRVSLAPLSVKTLQEALRAKGVPPDEAHYVSCVSQGVWSEAESKLAEKAFYEDDTKLRELLSRYSYELTESYLGRRKEAGEGKSLSGKRDVAWDFLQVGETFLRDVLVYRSAGCDFEKVERLLFFKHRKPWIEKKAGGESEESLCRKISEMETMRRRLDHNANAKLSLVGVSEIVGKPILEGINV